MQRRDEPAATRTPPLGREPLFLLAVLAGAWLRLHQIGEQIVADDEWHALSAALRLDYGELLTRFGLADHCIPLALLDKLLLETVGLSELLLRLPVLAAGIGSLLVLPWLLRPLLGTAERIAFTWLLAIAPLHVYFSRFARPYDIALLLSFTALVAAHRWWSGAGTRWGRLYVVCAALAAWFHLTTLPLALAPLLVFGVETLRGGRAAGGAAGGRDPTPGWGGLLRAGGGLLLGLALLLGPPLVNDLGALTSKTGAAAGTSAGTWSGAAMLWGGSESTVALLLLASLAVAGALRLARRQPLLVLLFGVAVAGQVAAVLVLRPAFGEYHIILARYALIVIPIGLVFVATALGALEQALRARIAALPQGTAGLLCAGALFWCGPLPFVYGGPNNWSNHAFYQYWYYGFPRAAFQATAREADSTGLYAKLGLLPAGELRLVEAPWYCHFDRNSELAVSQQLHRQWVAIGFVGKGPGPRRFGELPDDPRLRFRNFVHVGDAEGLRARGVRLVLFHRNIERLAPGGAGEAVPVDDWIARYRERYGAPLAEDALTVVFDIAK